MVLAGGLTPGNVAEAIQLVGPYAVDVVSGVEAEPGRKDHAKVEAFLRAVRETREPAHHKAGYSSLRSEQPRISSRGARR